MKRAAKKEIFLKKKELYTAQLIILLQNSVCTHKYHSDKKEDALKKHVENGFRLEK